MSTTSTNSVPSWVSMPTEVQLSVLAYLPSLDLVNFGLSNHKQQSLSTISLYHVSDALPPIQGSWQLNPHRPLPYPAWKQLKDSSPKFQRTRHSASETFRFAPSQRLCSLMIPSTFPGHGILERITKADRASLSMICSCYVIKSQVWMSNSVVPFCPRSHRHSLALPTFNHSKYATVHPRNIFPCKQLCHCGVHRLTLLTEASA
jgi:hypothetical protein